MDDSIGTTLWIALGLLAVMWRHVFILSIAGLAGTLSSWGLRETATLVHVNLWLFAPVPFVLGSVYQCYFDRKIQNKGS